MPKTRIDADLVIERAKHRYVVRSDEKGLIVHATAGAMAALGRKFRLGASDPQTAALASFLAHSNRSLQWRWGPLRLTLFRPDGPTRFTRLMKFAFTSP